MDLSKLKKSELIARLEMLEGAFFNLAKQIARCRNDDDDFDFYKTYQEGFDTGVAHAQSAFEALFKQKNR